MLTTSLHVQRYNIWKAGILLKLDNIVRDLGKESLETVMKKYHLLRRDIALMVRLGYFTNEEVDQFGLESVVKTIPS